MNETLPAASTLATPIAPQVALGPSLLQSVAALLVVIGLIYLVAYLLRRFAFGGQLARGLKRTKNGPTLALTESLWVDARHRIVTVSDTTNPDRRYTILIGPQTALQLQEKATGSHDASSSPAPNTISDIVA